MAQALSQDSLPGSIRDHYAEETPTFRLWTAFAGRLLQLLFGRARDRRRRTETTKMGCEAAGTPTLATMEQSERVIEGTPYTAVQDCFERMGLAHVCRASPMHHQTFGEDVSSHLTEKTASAAYEKAKWEEDIATPTLVVGCFLYYY